MFFSSHVEYRKYGKIGGQGKQFNLMRKNNIDKKIAANYTKTKSVVTLHNTKKKSFNFSIKNLLASQF